MNAREFYQAGQLDNAIKAIVEEVKKNPTDTNRRGFLSEMLLMSHEWERADKQLDMIGHQSPDAMMGIMLWRQIIRAGQARDQFAADGRVPEVLEVPDELLQQYLKAAVIYSEDKNAAAKILEQAENSRPKFSGTLDGKAFADFRDLDDSSPCVLEVFTSTGKYYWIPFSRIDRICMFKPESALDLVFRRAHLEINGDGPDGEVYLPATYRTVPDEDREAFLLGRTTDWLGKEGEPVIGAGQRMFLMDERAVTIMEIEEIEFNHK